MYTIDNETTPLITILINDIKQLRKDMIVIMNKENTELKIIKEDSMLVKEDNMLVKEDNRQLHDNLQIINDDNRLSFLERLFSQYGRVISQ